jgi:predicted phosphate transport protein (TIGR00153 family)
MFLKKLLPSDGNFFEQLNQHAGHMLDAARALSLLIEHYPNTQLRQQYTQAVVDAEHRADKVTHTFNSMLHQTFITPIDREQLHHLINALDDVVDTLQDAAETTALYDVRAATPDMVQFAQINLQCCEQLHAAVGQLSKVGTPAVAQKILETCNRVDALESNADQVIRNALSHLFREEENVRELIKLKAMYELLEAVSDRCEEVATLLEGIVLENS